MKSAVYNRMLFFRCAWRARGCEGKAPRAERPVCSVATRIYERGLIDLSRKAAELAKRFSLKKAGAAALAAMITLSMVQPFTSRDAAKAEETGAPTAVTQQIASTAGTTWEYLDNNTKPAAGWDTDSAFDDDSSFAQAGWKTAKGSFGSKRGSTTCSDFTANTLLEGCDGANDTPVYYFRTEFDLNDISKDKVKDITGAVQYDDAAVIKINGQKVAGFDDSGFDANGYGGSNEGAPKTGNVSAVESNLKIKDLGLKDKDNVLTVELHQGRDTSSDIYLDVSDLTLTDTAPAKEVKDVSLQVGSDETQKNITWLSESVKPAYVQMAVKPEGWKEGDEFPETDAVSFRAAQNSASDDSGYNVNKAVMKNLKEKTTYIYRVGNKDGWSKTYSFDTEDLGKGDSFNFLFAGDPQIGASGNGTNDTEGWKETLKNATDKFDDTSFILSAGDQINDKDSREPQQYDGYLAPEEMQEYSTAYNEGNHDSGSKRYSDHNYNPNVSNLGSKSDSGNDSGDYWHVYNGVLFMSINSNVRSTSQHREFMKRAIAENPDAKWKIVSFHHSVFSSASHATDGDILERRAELPEVFSELGIDAVLMGHDHVYTRTYMMDGNEPVVPKDHNVSKGEEPASSVTDPAKGQVFYLTANSASGSKYYAFNNNSLTDFIAKKDQSRRPNITDVKVTDDSLRFTTYFTDTPELEKLDEFTINKTKKEDPKPGEQTEGGTTGGNTGSGTVSPGGNVTPGTTGEITDPAKGYTVSAEVLKGSYTYTGKAVRPKVKVTDDSGVFLKEGTDYTVTYDKDSKTIGTHKIRVAMKGAYKGKTALSYKVVPGKAQIKKARAEKKKITLTLKKLKGGVRYQIKYKKSGSSKWHSKYTASTKASLKKLTKKGKYTVKVRAYRKASGRTYSGAWSKTVNVRVK